MTTNIGFTGTQVGMTPAQMTTFVALLHRFCRSAPHLFHHGDCIGADAEAHDLALSIGCSIVLHPCDIVNKRAFKRAWLTHPVKPPLHRNKFIVNSSEVLIATPKEYTEQLRSGTWSTIRYVKRMKKPYVIIYPNGTIFDAC